MAYDRLKKTADKKLASVGLKIKYKLWQLKKGESWTEDRRNVIHLNPSDAKSTMMARQNLQHILLHELGHLFEKRHIARKLKKSRKFIELFGNLSKHYRRDMRRKTENADFISNYAQVHPSENFAEVFAVYCGFEGKLKDSYVFLKEKKKSGRVKKQMLWLHRFIKSLS